MRNKNLDEIKLNAHVDNCDEPNICETAVSDATTTNFTENLTTELVMEKEKSQKKQRKAASVKQKRKTLIRKP